MIWYLCTAAALGVVAAVAYRYGRYRDQRQVIARAELLLCLTDQGLVSKDSYGQQPRHLCDWYIRLGKDDHDFLHQYCARCRVLIDEVDEAPTNLVTLDKHRRRSKKRVVASEVFNSTPPTAA